MATTTNAVHDIGVASQVGKYSDAIEVTHPGRLLFISGTPGLTPSGNLPSDFEQQAEQAWRNVRQDRPIPRSSRGHSCLSRCSRADASRSPSRIDVADRAGSCSS